MSIVVCAGRTAAPPTVKFRVPVTGGPTDLMLLKDYKPCLHGLKV
jgi:hypothetical protein